MKAMTSREKNDDRAEARELIIDWLVLKTFMPFQRIYGHR